MAKITTNTSTQHHIEIAGIVGSRGPVDIMFDIEHPVDQTFSTMNLSLSEAREIRDALTGEIDKCAAAKPLEIPGGFKVGQVVQGVVQGKPFSGKVERYEHAERTGFVGVRYLVWPLALHAVGSLGSQSPEDLTVIPGVKA